MSNYTGFAETRGVINASATTAFEFLDDQANLSAHMSKSSGMMMGSTMQIQMEPDHTRHVGSKFGFTGSILGIPLKVDEAVTSREPPIKRTWETIREPTLWVIGRYAMGFELEPQGLKTRIRVYIQYDLPESGFPRLLGRLFAPIYADWCTAKMVSDAEKHFAAAAGLHEVESA